MIFVFFLKSSDTSPRSHSNLWSSCLLLQRPSLQLAWLSHWLSWKLLDWGSMLAGISGRPSQSIPLKETMSPQCGQHYPIGQRPGGRGKWQHTGTCRHPHFLLPIHDKRKCCFPQSHVLAAVAFCPSAWSQVTVDWTLWIQTVSWALLCQGCCHIDVKVWLSGWLPLLFRFRSTVMRERTLLLLLLLLYLG